jgi:hypothetical protein
MKNTTIATIFSVACAAVAIYLGCELSNERKASKEKEERYNVDLELEATKVSREIEQGAHDRILDKAITDAANHMVEDILKKASNQAVRDSKNMLQTEIHSCVKSEWEATKNTVVNRMLTLAERCDINELKNDAVEAARDKMLDDLSDKLEELADKVNEKYEKKAEKIADSYEEKFKNRMQYRYGMFF